jgi:hypothetical protein
MTRHGLRAATLGTRVSNSLLTPPQILGGLDVKGVSGKLAFWLVKDFAFPL